MESGAQTFSSPHRPTGWFGLALVAAILAIVLLDGTGPGHLAFASGVVLFGAVVVAVYLRPSVVLREHDLLIRNALSDVTIPWGSVRSVQVRHVMEVDVGARVVRALAFGRTTRQQRRRSLSPTPRTSDPRGEVDYTDFVVDRVTNVARDRGARAPEGEVIGTWRWPEIAVLVALAVLTGVLALLA